MLGVVASIRELPPRLRTFKEGFAQLGSACFGQKSAVFDAYDELVVNRCRNPQVPFVKQENCY